MKLGNRNYTKHALIDKVYNEEGLRWCSAHKLFEPVEDFHAHPAGRYKLQSVCKTASNEKNRRKRKAHPWYDSYNGAKQHAKKLGVPFDMTQEWWAEQYNSATHCPLLGLELTVGETCKKGYRLPTAKSCARIDHARGYTPGNVIVTSWRANSLMGDSHPVELIHLGRNLEKLWHELCHKE